MEYDPAIFQAQIVRTVLKLQSNWKDSPPLSILKMEREKKRKEEKERKTKKKEGGKNDGEECLLRGE